MPPPQSMAAVASPDEREALFEALLARHRAGDPQALDALIRALYPSIRRIVFRLTRHREAHDDLVQAALEQVCRSLDSFAGRARLSSFVYGICHRVVARAERYDRVRTWYRGDAEAATRSDEPLRADELVERARGVAEARRLLDSLGAEERAAFVLFEVEELSVADVAAALGCSTRTVKRRLRTARAQLMR
jgi:RNA polymerase sigma-70 factor (ECF subfamily)